MPKRKKYWTDSDNPDVVAAGATRTGGKTALAWTLIVLGLIILVAVVWAIFTWGVSDVGGQMDAQREKNSAENRTAAQEEYVTRHQSVIAADDNIQIAYDEKQAAPDDQVKQINYSGLVRNCNDGIAAYNAHAQKFSSEEFRPDHLPAKLPDPADPTNTDCKEDTK
jgi:type II secretory pathway pseudopilin PulG